MRMNSKSRLERCFTAVGFKKGARSYYPMLAAPAALRARPKRPAVWDFKTLDTLRHRIIQRTGRLIRPKGELTLTMSANRAVRKDLLHFLYVVNKAA
ncbi:MAG: hypothetical protein GTO13_23145 [Proteobacteria bacterium]|nr:hypothetical protein [Pseudomonadota bacterium]